MFCLIKKGTSELQTKFYHTSIHPELFIWPATHTYTHPLVNACVYILLTLYTGGFYWIDDIPKEWWNTILCYCLFLVESFPFLPSLCHIQCHLYMADACRFFCVFLWFFLFSNSIYKFDCRDLCSRLEKNVVLVCLQSYADGWIHFSIGIKDTQ